MTKTGNTSTMNPEDAAKLVKLAEEQAQNVFKKVPLLGPVAWLLMQQPATRHLFLADLEWRVMPALVLDQAKLYLREQTPLAFVAWAKLSEAAANRYRQPPYHLAPSDWKSGNQIWIIDLVAPFGNAQAILRDVRENLFPTDAIHQLAPQPTDEAQIVEWPAVRSSR